MKTMGDGKAKGAAVVVHDLGSDTCVWSNAGVIEPIRCINAFDCLSCSLDKRLKRDIAAGRLRDGRAPVGAAYLRDAARTAEDLKCRHMLSGLVPVKYCVNDYDCERCEFNQAIEDEGLLAASDSVARTYVAGFALARNHYYHEGHMWARVEYGGRVRVGLDDFASRVFGPADRARAPRIGRRVALGEPDFSIERERRVAGCASPVDGIVVAVNPAMTNESGADSGSPYDRGWFALVEPVKLRGNLRRLMFDQGGQRWLESEVDRLMDMLGYAGETPLAATGGRAVPDIYGEHPELGWDRLRRTFLKT
ncbi:MAG: glycine cleavage system protein H [Desulfatibacillaceae bacterium]